VAKPVVRINYPENIYQFLTKTTFVRLIFVFIQIKIPNDNRYLFLTNSFIPCSYCVVTLFLLCGYCWEAALVGGQRTFLCLHYLCSSPSEKRRWETCNPLLWSSGYRLLQPSCVEPGSVIFSLKGPMSRYWKEKDWHNIKHEFKNKAQIWKEASCWAMNKHFWSNKLIMLNTSNK